MNIEFRFNGRNQIILTPENGKDKQLLQLFVGGNTSVKLAQSPAASPETVVIESYTDNAKMLSETPTKGLRSIKEIISEQSGVHLDQPEHPR